MIGSCPKIKRNYILVYSLDRWLKFGVRSWLSLLHVWKSILMCLYMVDLTWTTTSPHGHFKWIAMNPEDHYLICALWNVESVHSWLSPWCGTAAWEMMIMRLWGQRLHINEVSPRRRWMRCSIHTTRTDLGHVAPFWGDRCNWVWSWLDLVVYFICWAILKVEVVNSLQQAMASNLCDCAVFIWESPVLCFLPLNWAAGEGSSYSEREVKERVI